MLATRLDAAWLLVQAVSDEPGPFQITSVAIASSATLRASVRQLIWADETWPKQLQSGVRPLLSARLIAAMNTANNNPMATAPQRAVGCVHERDGACQLHERQHPATETGGEIWHAERRDRAA